MTIQFRAIRDWQASGELKRQLSQLVDEIQRVTRQLPIELSKRPQLKIVRAAGDFHAADGDFVIADLPAGTLNVFLPTPTTGQSISVYVVRKGTVGTVLVRPMSGDVNGTAVPITVTTTLKHFMNAGETWTST